MDNSSEDPTLNPDERRNGLRVRTVFQVARVLSDHRQYLCLIRNIGSGGMMLESFTPIAAGTRVVIEPKMFDPIEGEVRWSTGQRLGVAFDAPLALDDYLGSRQTLPAAQQPRGPRVTTSLRCRLRIGAVWHLVSVLDISQGGAKVTTDLPVGIGDEVELDLEGVALIIAHVRWTRGERVGIVFVQPIPLAIMGQWVARLSDRAA